MDANEALRFLTMLGVETAEDLGRARKPAMQEALMVRIQEASTVLRAALNGQPDAKGPPDGDPPA